MTIWHCILGAKLTKTYSIRLFFWRFCPLGRYYGLQTTSAYHSRLKDENDVVLKFGAV